MSPLLRKLRALALRRRLAAAALFLACAGLASAQSQARVSARLSSGVVKLGAELTLVATVENASFCEIRPVPAVDGLRIGPWSAPSERTLVQNLNGRTSTLKERTWAANVRPERKGEFTIPALEFSVDGALVRSQPLSLNVVEDLKGEELGTFELAVSKPRVVVGEPFTVALTFGWDAALAEQINWANLALPWWGQLAGATENDPPPPAIGAQQVDINLNSSETVRIERLPRQDVRGRGFVMFRLVRSFTATRAGALEFPTSWLEFGRVEEVGQLFTRRRERVESYFVRSAAVSVDVVPLPEAGRPPDYGGAIGRFQVRASADPRDVDAGESIKLKVEWTGAGNLEFFSPPEPSRSDAFSGFRVYGKTETKAHDRRTVTWDPLESTCRHASLSIL